MINKAGDRHAAKKHQPPRAKRLSPDAAHSVWRMAYLPLLRVVSIPPGLTTPAESSRLAVLADPHNPYGDPDDVPTATLALLLAAPLLSKDRNALRAVYGAEFDHVAHTQWLGALAAGGDLGPLSTYLQLSSTAIVGAGKAGVAVFRALARRVPWPWLLAIGAGAVGLASLVLEPAARREIRAGIGRILLGAIELVGEISALHSAAQREFATLAAPAPCWGEIAAGLASDLQLSRLCLHEFARAPQSELSAAELRDVLQVQAGEGRIRAALRTGACFEQVYAGRFQVGRALVRAEAIEMPTRTLLSSGPA